MSKDEFGQVWADLHQEWSFAKEASASDDAEKRYAWPRWHGVMAYYLLVRTHARMMERMREKREKALRSKLTPLSSFFFKANETVDIQYDQGMMRESDAGGMLFFVPVFLGSHIRLSFRVEAIR